MIRFQPDTLLQALLRYFDMVAPDANVYVEIPAPDIRFAAIALLAVAALLLWRRLGPGRNATLAMLVLLFVSTAIWLGTSGNGRYFMALLVCAGPLAIALVALLPVTRAARAAMALLLVAGQAFVLWQQPPFDTWTVMHWEKGSYFEAKLGPAETQGPPTTYASLSLLTYSLIAPQFPERSRWINLYTSPNNAADQARSDAFLRRAASEGPVKLIAPGIMAESLPDGRPTAAAIDAMNKSVQRRNLRVSGDCGFFEAPGLLAITERARRLAAGEEIPKLGFWTCPVAYEASLAQATPPDTPPPQVQQVLAKLGELCPRFFPPDEHHLLRSGAGWLRVYSSQTRAYVLDNGDAWYQFWRALNPVRLGTAPDLLQGAVTLDCAGVRNDGAWRTGAR